MMNLQAAQILSIPQGAKSDVAPKLPFPNGSIITAKLTPVDSNGGVIISLGGYRMRAQVPPNTATGSIWLQLLSRDMPAQFRLLSDAKAASMLSNMLMQQASKEPLEQGVSRTAGRSALEVWQQKLDAEALPFRMDLAADGQYIMLRDQQDDGTRGLLRRQNSKEHFLLHGRVDLDQLGAVAFSLEGDAGQPWKLRVYTGSTEKVDELRQNFTQWLRSNQREAHDKLDARVVYGLPTNLGSQTEFRG
ncbi:MAG: hypothetical protein R8K49_06885 [Mariprofundaceae bacterium]